MNHNYCIILAGGVGSRLWPVSRSTRPKQFLDLFGTGRTLLQATYDRMERIFAPDNIIISTCADMESLVAEQLPQVPANNILAEPIRRGTMPAALWANTVIVERDPDACVLCTPSDQLILREQDFVADVESALGFVATHHTPLTMGVRPTRPDTFYGYIQAGQPCADNARFAQVKAFTEKPDAQFAQMFVDSGEFYWNTGMNLWHARTMLLALKEIDTDYAALLLAERDRTGDALSSVICRQFGTLPSMSLDLTIQDRMSPVYVRTCSFGWADMGNWHSIYDDLPTDKNGNVNLHSEALLHDCTGNVIKMPHGVTLVMKGMHDMVVVQDNGVLLIAPKEDCNGMRRIMTEAQMHF